MQNPNASDQARKVLRQKCERDMFFLATEVLGYKDVNQDFHKEQVSDWFQHWPGSHIRTRMTLLPRGHFKTTFGTIVETLHGWLLNPMERVYNAHAKAEQTEANLQEIKYHLSENDVFRWIAPDICWPDPMKDAPKWLSDRIVIRRPEFSRVPSYLAGSVSSTVVGLHFDKYKIDDVVDDKNSITADQKHKIIEWFKKLRGTYREPTKVKIDIIGTRWDIMDLYGWLLKPENGYFNHDPEITRLVAKVLSVYKNGVDGDVWFPERFPPDEIEAIRKEFGSWHFSCQYLNDPVPSELKVFKEEDIRFYDPAEVDFEEGEWKSFTAVDPNRGQEAHHDPGCVCTVFINPHGDHFVHPLFDYGHFGVEETIARIRKHVDLCHPQFVAIETTAAQNWLLEWVYKEQLARNNAYSIREQKRGPNAHKGQRILRIQPIVERGQLYIPSPPGKDHPLYREMRDYIPTKKGVHDHALDALADIVQLGYEPGVRRRAPDPRDPWTLRQVIEAREKRRKQAVSYMGGFGKGRW